MTKVTKAWRATDCTAAWYVVVAGSLYRMWAQTAEATDRKPRDLHERGYRWESIAE